MKRLDAINAVLAKLKQPTVTTVNAQHPLVGEIQTALDTKANELLVQGFWFNTSDVTLQPEVDGRVPYPPTALAVEAIDYNSGVFVQRSGYLWNVTGNTGVFGASVNATVRWSLDFEELPEVAAEYVKYAAAVDVYSTRFGVDDTAQYLGQLMGQARSLLERDHLRAMRYNSVTSSPAYGRIMNALGGF